MFWGEPPRSEYDIRFSLLGIPVRIHPLFWVVAIVLGIRNPSLAFLLAWVAAVFVAILIHELGHALAMRAYGFQPSIALHGFGGLTSFGSTGSYRSAGYSALGQVVITAAGPGAGFLLAALVAVLLSFTGHEVEIWWIMRYIPQPFTLGVGSLVATKFVNNLLVVSVLWGVVNLLPVYPLDGGQIAREVFLKASPRDGIRLSLIVSIATAVGIAVIAVTQWNEYYVAVLFAYLAYSSYAALQSYGGRGPF